MSFTEIVSAADYRSPVWYEARAAGVTASEIAGIMDLPTAYDSSFSTYWRKKLDLRKDQTAAMSSGHYFESTVAEWWWRDGATDPELTHLVQTGLLRNDQRPWQLATPDRVAGFSGPRREPLEIKLSGTYNGWGPDGSDEIPVHYRAQVLWQMDVMDAQRGHVAVLFHSGGLNFRRYVIERDDDAMADIASMRGYALNFRRQLANDEIPPLTGHPHEAEVLKQLNPDYVTDSTVEVPIELIATWGQLRQQAKDTQKAADKVRDEIRQALGSAQTGTVDGVAVVKRTLSDVDGYTVKPFTVDKIHPKKGRTKEGNDDGKDSAGTE